MYRVLFFGCLLVLTSCKSIFDYPATINYSDSIENKLSYMVETDQKDRKLMRVRIVLGHRTKSAKVWYSRDSLRIATINDILLKNQVINPASTMNAGLILFHRDPTHPENDSIHLTKALMLFNSLMQEEDSTHILNGQYWSELTQRELSDLSN